ncbi:L,D-transpeptidase family protein [Gordonibacter pamelaeae]|uniref:L,D-transpeptidase family protein n=1 Tax=Gordonibacter pamelaeae TaxID=471189 RepID=UPI000302CF95|nr:L,D-transpeptidase family protein [Gordonibacter pamelaeae]
MALQLSEADAKGGRKPLKVLGIVLGVIVALLAVVYLAGALVFMDRFLPRTTVGDLDVSLKSSAEVQGMLADVIDDYVLKVEGQGFSLKLSAAEAGMRLDGRAATDAMHASANAWAWPLEILKAHDESDKLAATYNESGLGDTVRAAVDEFNKTATPPTDAVIAYSEAKGAFIVEPEAVGTALSYDAVIKAVDDAVLALQPTVKLGADVLQQPKVLSSDPKLTAAAEQANTMIKADLVLTMAGGTAGEVNADLISQWVRLGDDLSATLDEAALTAWVDELAAACNTVGTQRTYTRPDGKVVTVAGGVYGWSVDRDALLNLVKESVAAGTVQTAEVPCTSVGTGYNGAGAQDWGLRYCDIDLAEQYARFYDETGALIWESPIVSGIPDGVHDTSVGVYWLNQKASPSKLIGYENGKKIYESDVQYWMPFVGNVIGLHDADWQSSFGGTRYRDGAGSHGCVNLPPYKAAELYGIIQSGDVVVSHW